MHFLKNRECITESEKNNRSLQFEELFAKMKDTNFVRLGDYSQLKEFFNSDVIYLKNISIIRKCEERIKEIPDFDEDYVLKEEWSSQIRDFDGLLNFLVRKLDKHKVNNLVNSYLFRRDLVQSEADDIDSSAGKLIIHLKHHGKFNEFDNTYLKDLLIMAELPKYIACVTWFEEQNPEDFVYFVFSKNKTSVVVFKYSMTNERSPFLDTMLIDCFAVTNLKEVHEINEISVSHEDSIFVLFASLSFCSFATDNTCSLHGMDEFRLSLDQWLSHPKTLKIIFLEVKFCGKHDHKFTPFPPVDNTLIILVHWTDTTTRKRLWSNFVSKRNVKQTVDQWCTRWRSDIRSTPEFSNQVAPTTISTLLKDLYLPLKWSPLKSC